MVDKQKKIWLDGEFIDWDDAKVHVLTHSLHYGLAAFDGMRAYQRSDGGTYIFRLGAHIERLFDTCKMCMLQPKFTREQVEKVCIETLRVNGMVDGYLRPMVFIGEGAMGIYVPQNPVLTAVIAWRWGAYLGEEALKNGIRAKIGSFARHHINISLSKAKMNGQYTNSVLAKREAKLGGYDEAILLDANGYVSEGLGREHLHRAKRRALHAGPVVLDPRGRHARYGDHAGPRDGHAGRRVPPHARSALAGRRGVSHRHRGRDHAGARGRQPHDRSRARSVRSPRASRRGSSMSCAEATPRIPSG